MHLLFTELLCPSAPAASTSNTATSMFIMEETSNDNSNASTDIPRSLQASTANTYLSEVEEYLQSLTRPQNLTKADFHKFMQYN
jgi:hypothetical protein